MDELYRDKELFEHKRKKSVAARLKKQRGKKFLSSLYFIIKIYCGVIKKNITVLFHLYCLA